jgi:probable phosphoglycerate mutase
LVQELLIARHGEAHCNVRSVVGGPTGCTGLTATGREQARRLGLRLRRDIEAGAPPISEIHVSPRRRAMETAAIVSRALGVRPSVLARLSEPDYGPTADGATWDEVLVPFGGEPEDHPNRPVTSGGESWDAYVRRTRGVFDDLVYQPAAGRRLFVAHSETVRAAFYVFLGLPSTEPPRMKFTVGNTALTTWRATVPAKAAGDPGLWTLVSHNDCGHLLDG